MARPKTRDAVNESLSEAEILAQIPAARERVEKARYTGLRVAHARYSVTLRQLILTLGNQTELRVPARVLAALQGAPARALTDVHVSPTGGTVRWERLDVDLSVTALLDLALGPTAVHALFATAGGQSTSERKARAARLNGAKGGRPKR